MTDLLCPLLIGRDAETSLLRSALDAALGGAGRTVFVTGEAGIGKTRLASEVAAAARARGAAVLAGRAVPAGGSIPYRPLTEALQHALRDRALPGDPGLAPWLPALRTMVPAVAGPGDGHGDHSAAERGEAVLQLLRRWGGTTGLLLVIEDLHWADPDTLAIIEYLSDSLAAERVLCVATCRSESPSAGADLVARLAGRRVAAQLALGRLTGEQVAAMVRACLPSAADDVVARVQDVADGIPFLVEESLATSGVPRSFAGGVRARLAALTGDERLALHSAALLGRQFDWRLLPAATGLDDGVVARALERGTAAQLLEADAGGFRFRHMLTRESVAGELLPHQRATLAARALAAVEAAHPGLPGEWGDLAAGLAVQAGDEARAGGLLLGSGRAALGRGALATSADTLRRAAELLTGRQQRAEAGMLLVEALALAGRVDEAMLAGDRLIAALPRAGAQAAAARAGVHLMLARAAVDATRWTAARRQLGLAGDLLAAEPQAGLAADADVLSAEVAFADGDIDRARQLAESALGSPQAGPQVRCQALELLGRVLRGTDLNAARDAFERALATGDAAGLAVWRLRAVHQLGTIDMFDEASTERLAEARRIAGELGAASTGAVIDLQLTAVGLFRYALADAQRHAESAVSVSARLGLAKTHAIGLLFLAEIAALRRDRAGMEHFLGLAHAAEPGDPEIDGSALAGAHGMLALLDDDTAGARDGLRRGIALLDTLPQQGPAPYRAIWPLLLAASDNEGATSAIAGARRAGLTVNRVNRGILGYAEAVLAGRAGDLQRATDLAAAADGDLRRYPVWADLTRLLAAGPALAAGWGQPRQWLDSAAVVFARHGIEPLERRCRRLLDQPEPSRWAAMGITDRQADVLRLVAEGISNKEIAARLHLSPRTVEKHIESLLRKTAARSRTQLVAIAGPEAPVDARQRRAR